jgi:hypothetical protein
MCPAQHSGHMDFMCFPHKQKPYGTNLHADVQSITCTVPMRMHPCSLVLVEIKTVLPQVKRQLSGYHARLIIGHQHNKSGYHKVMTQLARMILGD